MKLIRIKAIAKKEVLQIWRDPLSLAMAFLMPVLLLVIFGYAITLDVNNITTIVYDADRSSKSRELAAELTASGFFSIVRTAEDQHEIDDYLDTGRARVAVSIPVDFAKTLDSGGTAQLQVIVDGSDSNTATIALGYLSALMDIYGQRLTGGRKALLIEPRVRAWYNPELKSKNYNVPGVIAMVIMLTSLLLTSMAVVREREMGTMEQLMVTPLRPVELILGKTIPFAVIAFIDMIAITILGVLIFNIPINGPLWLLPVCTAIYLLSVLGIGLFVSTVAKTQQQALMATFLFYMPAILLSGFMFPIENMPVLFQYLTFANPLRYFLVIIRGIFLKGNGLVILWTQMLSLLVLGAVVLFVSSLRFRKRLR